MATRQDVKDAMRALDRYLPKNTPEGKRMRRELKMIHPDNYDQVIALLSKIERVRNCLPEKAFE